MVDPNPGVGPRRILTYDELPAPARYVKSYLRRLGQQGKFPLSIQITAHRCGWYEDEVLAWIASRPRATKKVKPPNMQKGGSA